MSDKNLKADPLEIKELINSSHKLEKGLKKLILLYIKTCEDFNKLKSENEELLTKIEQRDTMIWELEQKINQLEIIH